MQDLYTSEEWKNATAQQRMEFVAKIRADERIKKQKIKDEKATAERMAKINPPKGKKRTRAQRKAAVQLQKKARRTSNVTPVKRAIKVAGIDVTSKEFLSTYEWRKVRMEALKKYGPVCQCCGTTPSHGAVMNVDHIKPRRLFPHLALDVNNLQVLCHECNHGKGNWDQTDWR
jgi:5-methylcytosine-specific restriction endonuclease McrA